MKGICTIYQIRPHLWAVDEIGRTTMYIYEGLERVLLLDTGFGLSDLHALIGNLCPEKEIVVVNTHVHGDHCSGNNQFETVYMGRRDLKRGQEPMNSDLVEKYREHFITCSPFLSQAEMHAWKPGVSKKSLPLKDGDIIDLGGIQLNVFETPGHTQGSICLWDDQYGSLFTGDMMLPWGAWGHLPESSHLCEYEKSIDCLIRLKPRELFPSHGKLNGHGWPVWYMPLEIMNYYLEGIHSIISGRQKGTAYSCFLGDGCLFMFPLGGITYDPDRIS